MCQEQSWLLLLRLCDVGLAASWLSTLLGPMAKLATVVAGAVSRWLLVVVDHFNNIYLFEENRLLLR
jgi:hypothetical protein